MLSLTGYWLLQTFLDHEGRLILFAKFCAHRSIRLGDWRSIFYIFHDFATKAPPSGRLEQNLSHILCNREGNGPSFMLIGQGYREIWHIFLKLFLYNLRIFWSIKTLYITFGQEFRADQTLRLGGVWKSSFWWFCKERKIGGNGRGLYHEMQLNSGNAWI